MKRYLIILLLLTGACAYGQGVTFNDLTNLSHLDNGEANTYLTQARSFRLDNSQAVNRQLIEQYKKAGENAKYEIVEVGNGIPLGDGAMLRTVYYKSNNKQFISNLISQAAKSGLKLSFKGLDDTKNIFIFDDDLYNITINLDLYGKFGMVIVKQKELQEY
ncbi:hypothetical protein EOD41_15600 [Mucilaginibacter limnophilus]|uniref:DUF4252 domain-containing protein n=1 Tax=Mucilaginibacter limnophilus TaxID=1932778 RepID=A0A437MQD0_9SPHI|nr:hypothetical protein [Mucilaginibacter limnophilus]RVT99864.1 hypothetical protein EOD41_15600 [Mucilaginibacter limnophilus]